MFSGSTLHDSRQKRLRVEKTRKPNRRRHLNKNKALSLINFSTHTIFFFRIFYLLIYPQIKSITVNVSILNILFIYNHFIEYHQSKNNFFFFLISIE